MKQEDKFRECSLCGQGIIPFKLGVCICGQQMGCVQYVENTQLFAKNYFTHLENIVSEKYYTAVDETFAGIEECTFIE